MQSPFLSLQLARSCLQKSLLFEFPIREMIASLDASKKLRNRLKGPAEKVSQIKNDKKNDDKRDGIPTGWIPLGGGLLTLLSLSPEPERPFVSA